MFQLAVLDAQLPVKQAFKLMHEEVCVLLCLQDLLSGIHFM
jgi:hypothetical protein